MRRSRLLIVLCLAWTLLATASAHAVVYTVNEDADTDDGACTVADCTLREAIDDSNASQGVRDEISFDAAMTVSPATALPSIHDTVTINGRAAADCSGAPRGVQLDGGDQGFNGLTLAAISGSTSNGSRICGLVIRDFEEGIRIQSDGNTIDGNRIGTTLNGESPSSNGVGVMIDDGDNNIVGGPIDLTDRTHNVISGNSLGGVTLVGDSRDNRIAGNLIGTDKDGQTAVQNGTGLNGAGITVSADTSGTVVGGDDSGERNVISGNAPTGIYAETGTITGNFIGVDLDGDDALPNTTGMSVAGAVTVGGDSAGEVNVISGNTTQGLFVNATATIQGNWIGPGVDQVTPTQPAELTTGTQPLGILLQGFGTGTASDSVIGGTDEGEGNLIAHHEDDGIQFSTLDPASAVDDVSVLGNVVYDNGDGELTDSGIEVNPNTTDTRIGSAAGPNVIRDNTRNGIYVNGIRTVVEGNVIGLDDDGADPAPNTQGVWVGSAADDARIGGPSAGAANTISGNTEEGILLGSGSTGTIVQGNTIGLDRGQGAARPNDVGIHVFDSDGAVIGGMAPGSGNTISGNTDHGIFLSGGVDGTEDPLVQGNTVGLSRTGADFGNGAHGLVLGDTTNAYVGGLSTAERNVFSGNDQAGISVQGDAVGARVYGNRIGVTADGGTARPNSEAGVEVSTAAEGKVTIGGTDAGAGNLIASNAQDGVRVDDNPASAAFLGNTFRSNGLGVLDDLGIDLGMQVDADNGANGNDPGDGDTGPNGLQNFPGLTSAVTDGSSTTVAGTIDTTPGAPVRIELFSSASCDESGHGQGEMFLGAEELTAGSGATAFTATVAGTTAGRHITATATDLAANTTSEFSKCRAATAAPAPPPPPPPPAPPVVAPALTPAVTSPPLPTAKFPAKLRVLRNGVDDGVLDMLIEITARAATPGAELDLAYQSSGRTTRFSVPITGTQIKVRKRLPKSQPKDTGITTVSYDGNDLVDPDEVRLRAADGKSLLVRSSSTLQNGRLRVSGTIADGARGVVRIRLSYVKPDNSTGFLDFRAEVDDGKWSLSETLPAEAASGGQLSIQFTGYEPRGLRGEQTSKQVP